MQKHLDLSYPCDCVKVLVLMTNNLVKDISDLVHKKIHGGRDIISDMVFVKLIF